MWQCMQPPHCAQIAFALSGRPDLEFGDKVILPQDAFRTINSLRLPFPLTFEVQGKKRRGVPDRNGAVPKVIPQYCGVLEFSAPEGQAYLPFWMMRNLQLNEGNDVTVKSAPKVGETSDLCT